MNSKYTVAWLVALLGVGNIFAATADINITSNTSQTAVNGASYSAYNVVNVNVSDGVTLTNTDQRVVVNPVANTTYNYNASGASGTGQLIIASALYNGFVLGQTGTACAINFNIDTVVSPTASVYNIIVQSGATVGFLKNVNASVMTTLNLTNATVNFGSYDGSTSGTFSSNVSGGLSTGSRINVYSNYTANFGSGKTVTVNDTSSLNVAGGTLTAGTISLVTSSTFTQSAGTTTANMTLTGASSVNMNGGTLKVEVFNTGGTSTFTQTAGSTTFNVSSNSNSTIGSGTKVSIQGGNVYWGGNYSKNVGLGGELEITGGTVRLSTVVNSGGVLKMKSGTYSNAGTFQLNGGSLEYTSGQFATGIGITASSSVKLYGDLSLGSTSYINFYNAASALDIYLNGFDFSAADFRFNTGGAVSLNLIVEDGYEWTNNSFHILNSISGHEMTEESIYNAITSITIDGVSIDKSLLDIVSDGGAGFYVNIVPEPAEWAAIFGALALGLAVYRRRRSR